MILWLCVVFVFSSIFSDFRSCQSVRTSAYSITACNSLVVGSGRLAIVSKIPCVLVLLGTVVY
jgi:hypothetical protein